MSGTPSIPTASMMNGRQHPTPTPYGAQFAAPTNRVPAPSPVPSLARSNSYVSQTLNETHRHHMPQSPHASFPQPSYPHQSTQLLPQHSTPSHTSYDHHRTNPSNARSSLPLSGTNTYNPPRPIEVFHLTDSVNNAIPLDIRSQFQRDEYGHVLFFTAPPLDASRIPESVANLGHSVRYLAKKARNQEERERKIKEREEQRVIEAENARKRAREEEGAQQQSFKKLRTEALDLLNKKLEAGTKLYYQGLYGDQWQTAQQEDAKRLQSIQEAERVKNETIKKHEEEREAARYVKF